MQLRKEDRYVADIDEGSYIAKFKGLEQRTVPVVGPTGAVEQREVLSFKFEVDGEIVEGLTSTRISNLSKAYKWLKALNDGKDFDEINTDELIDKEVLVTVANKIRGNLKFPTVVDVVPAPKKAKK